MIRKQPVCDGSGFSESLQRFRAGNEDARRDVLGGCLHLTLHRVEMEFPEQDEASLLDLVQELNATLNDALHSFTGDELDSFLTHVGDVLDRRTEELKQEQTKADQDEQEDH